MIYVEILPGFKPTTCLSAQGWGGLNITKTKKDSLPNSEQIIVLLRCCSKLLIYPKLIPDNKNKPQLGTFGNSFTMNLT